MIAFYIKWNTGLKKANLVSCNQFWDNLNHDLPHVNEALTLVAWFREKKKATVSCWNYFLICQLKIDCGNDIGNELKYKLYFST